jgi:hypothetical protein
MTPEQALSAAADLIESRGWTTRYYARNESGQSVCYRDDRAACYCAMGAIGAVANRDYDLDEAACNRLRRSLGIDSIAEWNDAPGRTAEEVVTALRKAAEGAGE